MTWRFLDTGSHDGPFNMAVDEALVDACRAGHSPPVFRVYRWEPWTLSLGRMEDAERRVDLAACRTDGVPIVRRPTGGRAVLHADELTYSVIARPGDVPVPATVGSLYRFVADVLVAALRSVGIPAMIWPPQSDGGRVRRVKPSGEPGRETLRRSPCFATVSQYEICADGKKLVGSAQRIWPDAMLQHGSILLGPAHCRIEAYLRGTALGSGTLAMRTTSISEVLGERIEPHVLARSLRDAASHVWKIPMEKKALTRRELEAVRNLVDTKYGIDAWNLRKASPEMKTDASGAHGH